MASSPNTRQPKIPFVDLAAQYTAIEAEVNGAIADVLRRTDFILGAATQALEQEFADYCQARYAVGVDSGMSALELALRAYEIGPGDEVITAANTFIATALAISHTGATPVLADVEPRTSTLDPDALRKAITARTKAVIPVHLYGHPADIDAIQVIAHQHGLIIVEDACQAHGARYKGRRVGSFGHAAAFSFYPGKNLGAYGDGGMVVTDDARVADAIKVFRNYGQREKYHHLMRGFNRRLDTLQSAVLRIKLRHLDGWNAARREHAKTYSRLLRKFGLSIPEPAEFAEPVYHLYAIRLQSRDDVAALLAQRGIATGVHYPVPIHLQPAYRDLGYGRGSFPVTEALASEILSLPMYPELSEEQIEIVVNSLRDSQRHLAVAA